MTDGDGWCMRWGLSRACGSSRADDAVGRGEVEVPTLLLLALSGPIRGLL